MSSVERLNGKVKWFNKSRGFGIIETNDEQSYFVHITSVKNKIRLRENEEVTFEVAQVKGKQSAINVEQTNTLTKKNTKKNRLSGNKRIKSGRAGNKTPANKTPAKNTESFNPDHSEPDMRVISCYVKPGDTRTFQEVRGRNINNNDVLIVNGLFGPGIYDKLIAEMESCGVSPENLWKLWHGDSHTIADDKKGWKENCPTFNMVIRRIKDFFKMDVKATRFNWYKDCKNWKPLHHDAAAIKKDKMKTQNFTIGCSFGHERDVLFKHAKRKTTVSLPLQDGSVYCFAKDVNIQWRHGIPQLALEKQIDKGRISVIAWGWVNYF